MKRRYKVLPLTFPFDLDPDYWEDCVTDEIKPVFHRNGFYLDRLTNKTWLEINGKAWFYLSREGFEYNLLTSEGNNWLEWHVWDAIGLLIKNRLASKELKQLYYIQRDRWRQHQTGRTAGLAGLRMSKRVKAFKKSRQNAWENNQCSDLTTQKESKILPKKLNWIHQSARKPSSSRSVTW